MDLGVLVVFFYKRLGFRGGSSASSLLLRFGGVGFRAVNIVKPIEKGYRGLRGEGLGPFRV